MEIKRGEIWMINLDPTVGHEIKKVRPGVVIQNDLGNRFSPITIIVPISSQKIEKVYPFEVFISKENNNGLEKDSKIVCNQMRAIDKRRLSRKIGTVSKDLIEDINTALKISLDLD
ncbi:MAG TPA: type II toxin-antitoxin system PemK/MazF family toxin [Nanoarchaeota archaeon]|nr:type II toxin-antitoxin system PemK/MazF family toxin [Nanoarchaeota archaeon]